MVFESRSCDGRRVCALGKVARVCTLLDPTLSRTHSEGKVARTRVLLLECSVIVYSLPNLPENACFSSAYLSSALKFSRLEFFSPGKCSRMFSNVLECSRMFSRLKFFSKSQDFPQVAIFPGRLHHACMPVLSMMLISSVSVCVYVA